MAPDIRQRALERLAALSAQNTSAAVDGSDLDRMYKACPGKPRENGYASKQPPSPWLARVPMNIREFEVLVALCKAAPLVQSGISAQKLAKQLFPYMLDAHVQVFTPSPFFRKIEPSPTEALTFHVTAALLSLGINHDTIHDTTSEIIWKFVNGCNHAATSILPAHGDDREGSLEDAIRTATIAVSLLGFIDAAAAQTEFWRPGGRMALVQGLKKLLSDPFLIAVETAFSTIRNSHSQDRVTKEWKRHMRVYSEAKRPLGAMLLQRSYARLLVAATSLLVADVSALKKAHVLDLLMSGEGLLRPLTARSGEADFRTVDTYASRAMDQMNYLDASADFIRMGSAAQQHIACGVRAATLVSFLNCARLNEDAADVELLMTWLEEALADPVHMAHEELAATVLRAMALVCRIAPALAANVSRLLPRFIVQSAARGQTIETASKSLAFVLQLLSSDAVITTLYTLGNVLSSGSERGLANGLNGDAAADGALVYQGRHSTGSSISLPLAGDEEASAVYGNVLEAICGIASSCRDVKITALAQSMILQKIDKISLAVDAQIVAGAASLALSGGSLEFRSLLKLYSRICHTAVVDHKDVLLHAVMRARNHISAKLRRDSPLFDIYWEHLVDGIISKGDVLHSSQTKESDVQLAAREIEQLLQPLAIFLSANDFALDPHQDDERHAMLRDAWFNIVVHGFTPSTERGQQHANELRIMAVHSPPLVAEQRGEQVESDIELNTVLRRAMSSERESVQKRHLCELIPSKAAEIRNLSYRKVIFLHAAYLVESLRADSGNCATALSYFLEPSMRRGDVSSIMEGVTGAVVERYLQKTLGGASPTFSSQYAASQLVAIFCACCHRIERVQQAAYGCADRIVREVPSALCHRSSLFALLELLSLMWSSCLEGETDLYEPRTTFRSARGRVTVELSDDYAFRRLTLDALQKKARAWVTAVVNVAPADIKGLLQTYLSDFDDDGAYGHVSLGRSFALEMGSAIPATDQRLQSLNQLGDGRINTASDFVAQYTTRQEYRYAETLPDHSMEWLSFMRPDRRSSFLPSPSQGGGSGDSADAVSALAHIEARLLRKKTTPLGDVRDILRRAAALLCRSEREECAVAHYLVSIPFAMFTKQSIKLGVSLWLGVMNENALVEPRLLNEIAAQWELSIQKKQGLFSAAVASPDPFFLKKEFAPSDSAGMAKRKQVYHNLLSPHTRLLQFLASHFNATRLGSPDTQKVFLRLLDLTLDALRSSRPHPMARDLRFQIILFGLRVLRLSTTMGAIAQWRLKDKILSAALSWFHGPPCWSYGSNILQMKTEIRLMSDVMIALGSVAYIGAKTVGDIRSLQNKEQLLLLLLESEQARLKVWVYPLAEPPASSPSTPLHTGKGALENALVPLIRTAWVVDPSLAIGLATRFQNPRVHKEIRWLLLKYPTKAVSVADALPVLLDGSLPSDVSFQLKYLLFWAPVCPITAVTYFLPAFQDHPLIIQYAMRALESHSVDVTFFYVPQIVQTLRYDALGYVERYIIETAQFSQLFAHQIIWNMKANAYQDDDSTIPDPMKPTLDKVMTKMVDSFAVADRGFYEKEFAFFDEVTSISGKLKPLIKKPREEKKQKIEEELRKIKVEVGVYLPSNPDGVVIGIDRKSGKPLQSHAKAPFMATFRIKKTKSAAESTDNLLEEAGGKANGTLTPGEANGTGPGTQTMTVEVWQSAIFKVGDDCRQDVLALQMIAAFRGIFQSVGLDAYVFPYRVTATAPGCGVIDVLPNSISRDMLGREAVNGLYEYFISKYGNEDSLRYQQARNNFVKSMAAYSIISFLLQFKDRHNGNIMIDDAGHILHIDFGFCFDIAPGGIKFERAPFKLTTEMMAVMGGSTTSQAFKWFEELCVKSFLASRQHCEKLSQIVLLMMDSGLPCFRPESVSHFKERFVLEKSEREAADFVKNLIRKSHSSYSTGVYDTFQLMTNGIPY